MTSTLIPTTEAFYRDLEYARTESARHISTNDSIAVSIAGQLFRRGWRFSARVGTLVSTGETGIADVLRRDGGFTYSSRMPTSAWRQVIDRGIGDSLLYGIWRLVDEGVEATEAISDADAVTLIQRAGPPAPLDDTDRFRALVLTAYEQALANLTRLAADDSEENYSEAFLAVARESKDYLTPPELQAVTMRTSTATAAF